MLYRELPRTGGSAVMLSCLELNPLPVAPTFVCSVGLAASFFQFLCKVARAQLADLVFFAEGRVRLADVTRSHPQVGPESTPFLEEFGRLVHFAAILGCGLADRFRGRESIDAQCIQPANGPGQNGGAVLRGILERLTNARIGLGDLDHEGDFANP